MRITKAEVKSFRILEDATIDLDEKVTLVVGRNNSGKTSLTEVFYKFLGDESSQFKLEDFSISSHKRFKDSYDKYLEYESAKSNEAAEDDIAQKESAFKDLPAIELRLSIQYEDADNIASLSKFIMDLDDSRKDALLVCRYRITKPEAFFQEYDKEKTKYGDDIIKFLKKNYTKFFSEELFAADARDESNTCDVTKKDIASIFLTGFIYAQNQLDDLSVDKSRGLSRGFEDYFKFNSDTNIHVEDIEQALADVSKNLDEKYIELFSSIFKDLEDFGIGTGANSLQKLKIVSLFEAGKILKGNTQLFYSQAEEDDMLPEAHNGLGYTKLIYTILRFISFYEEFAKRDIKPGFQLIFVEEPEAHLHPQMQYVFIKNIKDFVAKKDGWNVQIVVTTHSSHIVAESGFECIRYFDNSVKPLEVRNLSAFKKKQAIDNPSSVNFIEQFMTLHRCDMFFADKVILIEGTVERLLLPEMIRQVMPELLHQYISVIEVGGAYAHNFKELLAFLNVQTLIITDIDSGAAAGHHPACPVSQSGAITSNATLKQWLPRKSTVSDLLVANDASKLDGKVKVTYQLPEDGQTACGRSFEEAFILCNAGAIAANQAPLSVSSLFISNGQPLTEQEIKDQSYTIALTIPKKTDFAFDIITLGQWQTPKYISDGLKWLGK